MLISIPSRFSGPPDSGNGGYTAGLLAETMHSAGADISKGAEITLRKPIPLETAMRVDAQDGKFLLISTRSNGEELIVEGKPSQVEAVPPVLVDFAHAQEAARHSPAFHNHPFPTCFVCG